MKRSEKVRLAQLSAQQAEDADRDPAGREAARREWGDIRRSAREAFLAQKDWMSILNSYRDRESYYSYTERDRMCKDFTEELINRTMVQAPGAAGESR